MSERICSVDGCDNKAVAEITTASVQNRGYRCRDCLVFDLDL